MRTIALAFLLALLPTLHAQLNVGLRGHWTFAAGSTLDQSGQANDGTILGNVSMTTDRGGSPDCALLFPGNNSHVTIPFSSDFDRAPTDALTISLWYQGGSVQMGDLEWLFGKRIAGGAWSTTDYSISLYDLNRVLASLGDNGELWSPVMPPVPDPLWSHVAYVYSNGIHQIWLNNALVATDSTQQVFVSQSNQSITIGAGFEGAIDDIRFYDRALSPMEMDLLFQEPASCSTSTGIAEPTIPAISVAPNPTTDILTVLLPEAKGTLELFDATGRSVQQLGVTSTTTTLSIGHLPNGLYLLHYGSAAGAVVQRIAKR